MKKFRLLACLLCFGVAFCSNAEAMSGAASRRNTAESSIWDQEGSIFGNLFDDENEQNAQNSNLSSSTNSSGNNSDDEYEDNSADNDNDEEGSDTNETNDRLGNISRNTSRNTLENTSGNGRKSRTDNEYEDNSEDNDNDDEDSSINRANNRSENSIKKNSRNSSGSRNTATAGYNENNSQNPENVTDESEKDTSSPNIPKKNQSRWKSWFSRKSNKNTSKKAEKNSSKRESVIENDGNTEDIKSENSEKIADISENETAKDTSSSDTSKKTQSKWKSWFSRKSKERAKNNPAKKAKKSEKDDNKEIVSENENSEENTSDDAEVSKSTKRRHAAKTKKREEKRTETEEIETKSEAETATKIGKKSNGRKKSKKPRNINFKINLSNISKKYRDTPKIDTESTIEEFDDTDQIATNSSDDFDNNSDDFSEEIDENTTGRLNNRNFSPKSKNTDSASRQNKRNLSSRAKINQKNTNRTKPKDIKFNINLSRFTLNDEEDNSSDDMMMPTGNMIMPVTNAQLPQNQGLVAQQNQMMNLQPVAIPQTMSVPSVVMPQQTVPMQQTIPAQQPEQLANQNFNIMPNQTMDGSQQNDEEEDADEGMNQMNMMQPLDMTAPINTTTMPNNMPVPMYSTFDPVNNQMPVPQVMENNNSNPSFLETFLQNLNGQNTYEQNQMQQFPNNNMLMNGNNYSTDINQLNQRISTLEQYLMNNSGQINSMQGNTINGGKNSRNLSDDEVAEEVIQYLRELDVLDEAKFSQMRLRDIGICIRCRNRKEVIILDKARNMGICKSCARILINDALNGKFLGDASMLNRGGYERDRYGRTHERGSSMEEDLFGGSNGGIVGSLISAGVTNALMKKSSDQQQAWNSNPNFGMGANGLMSAQGMPMQGAMGLPGMTQAQGMAGMMPQGTVSPNGQAQGLNTNGAAFGTSGEQMVLNAAGQLVPLSSLAGTGAPYGYVIDPQTGALIPAQTLEEGLAAAQQYSAATSAGSTTGETSVGEAAGGTMSEQMVLNAEGQLVPLSSLTGTGAPYGYVIDPQTGTLIPAQTLEEGLAAAQAVSAQTTAATQQYSTPTSTGATTGVTSVGGAAGGTMSEQMVLNAAGQLVPLSSLAGTGAPYGYIIDPQTGALIPAQSLEEGLAAAQAVSAQTTAADQQYSATTSAGATTGVTPVGGAAGGTMSEQMVLNAAGQLVPLSALAGSATPYGYKIDPATGMLIPASSIEEGLAAAQQILAQSNQQTTVPQNLMNGGVYSEQQPWTSETNNSLYGTNFDQTQQTMNTGTKSGGLLSSIANATSGMGKYGKVAAGVAAGAAVLGAGVAAVKALKKNKDGTASATNGTDGNTAKSGGSKLKTAAKVAAGVAIGAAALGGTYLAYKAIKKARDAKASGSTATSTGTGTTASSGGTSFSDNSSASKQSETSVEQYSAEEVKQAKKTNDELTKKIKKAQTNLEKAKKTVQSAEATLKKKEEKLSTAKNKNRAQNEVNSAKEALERAQKTLAERQETLDNLQQQQATLKEKYGKELGGPA